jgi:hypothetical protein
MEPRVKQARDQQNGTAMFGKIWQHDQEALASFQS